MAGSASKLIHYVYVLYSKEANKFYIGYSTNLKKRLIEHRKSQTFAGSRLKYWKFVYCEICISKKDAQNRERQLKTGFGRGYLRRRLRYFLMGG